MKILSFFVALFFTGSIYGADVFVIRPVDPTFEELAKLVSESLRKDYEVESKTYEGSISYSDFARLIPKDAKVVITMDNLALKHLWKYFEENPQSKTRGIATMGVNLKDVLNKNKYIAGVAYEVAGYLSVRGFQKSIDKPIRRVLAPYRSSVSKVLAEEAKLQLSREKIELDLLDIEGVPDDELKGKIEDAMTRTNPDVLWLLNDNKMVNSQLVSNFWIKVARVRKLPIICGIQKLARELGICMYAETPSLRGISQKVSDIAFGYIIDENDADFYGVEYIQETEKTLNRRIREKVGISRTGEDVFEYDGTILGE